MLAAVLICRARLGQPVKVGLFLRLFLGLKLRMYTWKKHKMHSDSKMGAKHSLPITTILKFH